MDCIFCKIVKKEVVKEIILENDSFLVFKDIHPKAETHVLIVLKEHIKSVDHVEKKDALVLGEIFLTAKEVAEKLDVSGNYKLAFNVGKEAGQLVDHIHMHLLAGEGKEVVGV